MVDAISTRRRHIRPLKSGVSTLTASGQSKKGTKRSASKKRRSVVRLASYSAAFLLFITVIAAGYQRPESSTDHSFASVQAGSASSGTQTQPSVDQVVATNVAASLTEQANMPIAPNVANIAQSLAAQSDLAQTDTTVISKPQILQPTASSRTLRYYVTKQGDTVQSVAAQFGVSDNTIRWVNNLALDNIAVNTKLTILPTDGILYTFKAGDSVAGIAQKYSTSPERVISYNDLEVSTAQPGQQLIIPGGILPTNEQPGYIPPTPSAAAAADGQSAGAAINVGLLRASAGNRYAPGNCTWYAYERREQLGRPVGSYWGNANTWAINARAAGYVVNGTPVDGAVLVDQSGYYGHVAIVEQVQSNGDILVSEMNNYAYGGFGVVDKRVIPASQVSAYVYIH